MIIQAEIKCPTGHLLVVATYSQDADVNYVKHLTYEAMSRFRVSLSCALCGHLAKRRVQVSPTPFEKLGDVKLFGFLPLPQLLPPNARLMNNAVLVLISERQINHQRN